MFIILAIPIVCVGVINLTQAVLGRTLIRPERSTRPTGQLRRESALAATEMLGLSGVAIGLQINRGSLIVSGLVVGLGALAAIYLWRRKTA